MSNRASNRVSNEDTLRFTRLKSGRLQSANPSPAAPRWRSAESRARRLDEHRNNLIDRPEGPRPEGNVSPATRRGPADRVARPSGEAIDAPPDRGLSANDPLPASMVLVIGAATACISTIILAGILAAMIGFIPPLAILPWVILLYVLCCASVPIASHLAKRSARLASRRMLAGLQLSRAPEARTIASTLAHELNQPLTAVSHYIEGCRTLLAKEAGPENSKLDRALACASSEAIRAARIVRHMREFEAREDTALAVEDLNDVVTHAVTLLDRRAEQAGAAIVVDLDDVGTVYASRIQIEQVLVNLIRNAIDALQDCPTRRITVKTRRCGEEAQVVVEDSGRGVPPQLANRLFEPVESGKEHGMGLGLSICRTIVEAHGGAIWAGKAERGGAAFGFTVPRCPEDAYSAA